VQRGADQIMEDRLPAAGRAGRVEKLRNQGGGRDCKVSAGERL
jgi:hypothetical protein